MPKTKEADEPKEAVAPVPANRMVKPSMVRLRARASVELAGEKRMDGEEFEAEPEAARDLIARDLAEPIA